jgi:hypothetical protein
MMIGDQRVDAERTRPHRHPHGWKRRCRP